MSVEPIQRVALTRPLFVCWMGRNRSRTAARLVASQPGVQVDYGGIGARPDRVITQAMVDACDSVFAMEHDQRRWFQRAFPRATQPIVVLGIEDIYDYMQPELVNVLRMRLREDFPGMGHMLASSCW